MPLEPYQIVNQSEGPPPRSWTKVYAYDANSNLEYEGFAQSLNKLTEWTIAAGSLVQIVVLTNVATIDFGSAHGLEVGMSFTVSGASDAELNTTLIVASVPDSDTITATTSGVSDATYNNVGLKLTTYAPRKNDSIWSIRKYFYDATNRLIASRWAQAKANTQNLIWDSRTTYAYL